MLSVALLATGLIAATSPTPPASPAFVGSGSCKPCHATQYDSWQGSNHQRAMQPANRQTVLGDFGGVRFTQFGVTSRFYRKDGKLFVHTEGADGKLGDFEVGYTFGVEPLQQYLIPFPGGRLQSLTIAWDTRPREQGGQRWFSLYPDEKIPRGDPLHWTGSSQNWNYMCAFCHATNLQKGFDPQTNRYDTTWSELGVGCEACHGPGSAHVAWAQAKPDGGDAQPNASGDGLVVHQPRRDPTRWVIDPQTGNARPQAPRQSRVVLDTCAPCHSRRTLIAADPRPGQPLMDAYLPALLTEGVYRADGQVEAEDYEYGSFLQSRMYRDGVTCSDCHEPHSQKLRAPGNAVCARCHLASKYDDPKHHFHARGSKGASCAGCHMPTRTYMIVDPRHDHSLRIPRPDQSESLGVPNACNGCHADRDARWARSKVREWYGRDPRGYQTYAGALHAGRAGAADAESQLRELAGDTAQPGIARATALTLLRAYLTPASIGVVRAALGDGDPLVRRAAIDALEAVPPPPQRLAMLAPSLDDPVRGVRIEAARLLAPLATSAVPAEQRAAIARGVGEYVEAQRLNADRPEARVSLGALYAEGGRYAAAEAEYEKGIELGPWFTPAYVNLADLYRVQQRDGDGERLLRRGLARMPADAALHHALGLLLVREKKLQAAIDELRQAARLRPEEARYSYVLGIALNSAGNSGEALEVLRAAHERRPADVELLRALATISRDHGDTAEAQKYARELAALAPDDPVARQLGGR